MKRNVIIVGVLAVAVVVVVGIKNQKEGAGQGACCSGGICAMPEPLVAADSTAVAPVEMPLPKLLDLGAGKCIPCKAMAPILDEMKKTFAGQLDVEFIDVWENEEAGEQYGIRMIPTQIFFDTEGRELFRHEGFFAREDMLAKWAELGFAFADQAETSTTEGN